MKKKRKYKKKKTRRKTSTLGIGSMMQSYQKMGYDFMRDFNKKILKDTDKDRVPNIFDCRPYNPRMHGIKPSDVVEAELKKLPIYFTADVQMPQLGEQYHYTEKKMAKGAYKAKKRFQGMVKKRPKIIGEIKKRKAIVIFTPGGIEQPVEKWKHVVPKSFKGKKVGVAGWASQTEPYEFKKAIKSGEVKGKGQHLVVVRVASKQGIPYRYDEIQDAAGTTIHELEHVRQAKAYEKKPKLAKRMRKGTYKKRRIEVMAREAQEKAERKRYAGFASRESGLSHQPTLEKLKAFMKRKEEEEDKALREVR